LRWSTRGGPLADSLSQPQARLVFVPYEKAYEPGFEDMRRRVPDTAKINRLTGWQPRVALDETLRRVIAHFAQAQQARS
jgi:UDP-glucose 4-epimerase